MKIGILTFHCAHNYGAVLQCYALQETLRQMGHDVEVIDYRPEYLLWPYRWFDAHRFISKNPIKALKKSFKELVLLRLRFRRYNAFNSFISNRLHISERVSADSIPNKYNIHIMGSDQIWNPKITKGFDPVYFGKFKFPKEERKYIAYAASMEAKSLRGEEQNFYKQSLKNFDAVSVRERQLAELLQPLTSKKVEAVIDPTLLADKNIWESIAKQPKIKQKYVLVYQVRSNEKTIRIAESIANQLSAIVIEIKAWMSIEYSKRKIQCASPEEFIGWIKYASCIVTTSFHGTAFSIIFNRPFYCITLGDGGDSRSLSLLTALQLDDRMVNKNDSPVFSEVNYERANKLLLNLKMKSLLFLTNAVNGNEYI